MKKLIVYICCACLFTACKRESKPGIENRPILNGNGLSDLSSQCMDPSNCDDLSCEAEITSYHEVSANAFNEMLEAYYADHEVLPSEIPPPLEIAASQIQALVAVACDANRVRYDLHEDDITTHQNIDIFIQSGYSRSVDEIHSYSIALFKGILQREPDVFKFYRGKSSSSTLLIAAYKNNSPVYIGDLTGLYP